MKKIAAVLAITAVFCLIFTGCTVEPFKAVESLMRPPAFSDADEDLISAFEKSAGTGTAFCAPVSGDYSSAIVIEDLGGNFAKQALVFYTLKTSQGTVRVNFLEYNGDWVSSADLMGYGTGVESVSFEDLDLDGSLEAIVCWRTGSGTGKVLSVYRRASDSEPFREISNENYSAMTCVDIDSDELPEVITVSQTTVNGAVQNTASVLKVFNGEMIVTGSVRLDGNVSSYSAIKSEKTDENSPMRVFIDAKKGETQMITEVIYWDENERSLKAPFIDPETLINSRTLRYEPIPCMDIDNDGSIDIPVQTVSDNGAQSAQTEGEGATESLVKITTWNKVSGDELVPVRGSVVDMRYSYIFLLNSDELKNIRVSETKENCRVFSFENPETGKTDEMFSVLVVPQKTWNQSSKNSYTVLYENEDILICAYLTPAAQELGTDGAMMKERLITFKP